MSTAKTSSVSIAGRRIGPDEPPFIVAELSANHNGSLQRALEHVRAAKACGADAIKFQTYTASTLTIDSDADDFRIRGGLWDGLTLYELYQRASTPWEWHEALFQEAREQQLIAFSTPFDATAVDLLQRLDAPAIKVASFEVCDLPLLARVACVGRPVVLSTGLATLAEIGEAVETLRGNGAQQIVLLHCVSAYPAPASAANLLTIPHLEDGFGVPVGLSDHTSGIAVACAATALGACVIEKHFILDRSDGGPDAEFSLEPNEFEALVAGCRVAWQARGKVSYVRHACEESNRVFRRSIYAVRDIAAGDRFTSENVRIIRPGFGLAPRYLSILMGRRAARELRRGERITWDVVD